MCCYNYFTNIIGFYQLSHIIFFSVHTNYLYYLGKEWCSCLKVHIISWGVLQLQPTIYGKMLKMPFWRESSHVSLCLSQKTFQCDFYKSLLQISTSYEKVGSTIRWVCSQHVAITTISFLHYGQGNSCKHTSTFLVASWSKTAHPCSYVTSTMRTCAKWVLPPLEWY